MKALRLIVDITTRDDKTQSYDCVDSPAYASDFVTLYLPNFERQLIRTESILSIRTHYTEA